MAAVALTLAMFAGCRAQITHYTSRMYLGTIVNITIVADSHEHAARAAEAAFAEIGRIEALMSPRSTSGDVYRINQYASRKSVAVSDETFELLLRAKEVWGKSSGAFDITFASIASFWNLTDSTFKPPTASLLKQHLGKVDSAKMILNRKKKTVKFSLPGMKIGLGGIAKGYAIMRAIEVLRAQGIQHAIVEAGGDLMVIGDNNGRPWRVGLRNPRKDDILAVLSLRSGETVATSGDYERLAMYQGRRYHHILDPKTGFPANRCISVSVLCDDPVKADAYATAFFVMGKEQAFPLANKENVQAIVIEPYMNIYVSESLKEKIHIFGKQEVVWMR